MYVILNLFVLLLCFYLLAVVCDDFFVWSLNKISKKLKISSEVTGATFMAIGSSAPELFTSVFALFFIFGTWSNESMGAGTIVWSAIFNVLVITWISLIFAKKHKKLYRQPIVRDLWFYALTVTCLLFFFLDGKVVFSEVAIMVALYVLYVFVVSQWSKWLKYDVDEDAILEEVTEEVTKEVKKRPIYRCTHKLFSYLIPDPDGKHYRWTFSLSVVVIALLSYFMVDSAVAVAEVFSIPKVIVGLTILAVWTSIPDLLSSVIVAKKWKLDMAISNGLWSNVFDILIWLWFVYFIYFLVYWTSWFILVDRANLWWSTFLLFGTVIIIIFIFALRKWKTNKWIGRFFLLLYLMYLWWTIYTAL